MALPNARLVCDCGNEIAGVVRQQKKETRFRGSFHDSFFLLLVSKAYLEPHQPPRLGTLDTRGELLAARRSSAGVPGTPERPAQNSAPAVSLAQHRQWRRNDGQTL